MSDADHDPMMQRAIDELRQLPPLDREAVRRVVDAAASARRTRAHRPLDSHLECDRNGGGRRGRWVRRAR